MRGGGTNYFGVTAYSPENDWFPVRGAACLDGGAWHSVV